MGTTIERKIASEVENVPFCLALSKDAGKYAKDDTIIKLKQFGKTVQFRDFDQIGNSIRREARLSSKKFQPDNECLTEYEISQLASRSGIQSEEYMMRSGSPVTAIGRLSWADENRKHIQISRPESTHRLILTTDVDAVLLNMEEEAHRYNVARRTVVIVGVVLLYVALDRFYRDFRIWWKKSQKIKRGEIKKPNGASLTFCRSLSSKPSVLGFESRLQTAVLVKAVCMLRCIFFFISEKHLSSKNIYPEGQTIL